MSDRWWMFIIFTPIWVLTIICLLKCREVFILMEADYKRREQQPSKQSPWQEGEKK